ncbi:Bax inhibitor-1/YccA family protein [Deinococcus roseus]|uniref:Bax inhibitor-1/YccA family protein n=1 Tax=Deinococcus roseus TaxID=392414 RepID=A0ABQ2CUP9_9DEIO|nr:Bax inhibitor-1/YccA family protein [Deinococcus roseus]GGJ22743.1 hypothetical protein GCM10008938_06220 [Deinococcus roseus]
MHSLTQTQSVTLRSFLGRTFSWMTAGMVMTAIAAWFAVTNEGLFSFVRSNYFMLVLLELGMVFGLGFLINRISAATAGIMFSIYAVLNGLTLSGILLAYHVMGGSGPSPVVSAFITTAGLFGTMAVVGYTTKMDLSRFGTIFFMGVIGLVIASIVNIWIGGSALSMVISVVGVILFCAITAYDMQKLKEMALSGGDGFTQSEMGEKMAVFGALNLYLDFINIFLFLLRLFGGGRSNN